MKEKLKNIANLVIEELDNAIDLRDNTDVRYRPVAKQLETALTALEKALQKLENI